MSPRSIRKILAALTIVAASTIPASLRAAGSNPNETVDTTMTAAALAQTLVGPGVAIDNVVFTGAADARGTFSFADPAVTGMSQGAILSSGNAHDVVGPNTSDSFSTDWTNPGDADLDTLSGFATFDAAVLEFDFVPTANQVAFQYAFSSDEYSEYVNTQFNDVFAFFINGSNCAVVRQTAGDPLAPFVPVAVNNINDSNPGQVPPPTPMRPDLFRDNAFNGGAPSALDLELDGITRVMTCQSPVNPGVTNHMKLAIADASDHVFDSAVFIEAGSLVSNENPTADLGLDPSRGTAPLLVTASVEGHDPNNLPLTYTIDWGDGSSTPGQALPDLTTTATHTYVYGGTFIVTLTISNGTLTGSDHDDVDVSGPPAPTATPTPGGGPTPTPTATATSGGPTPTVTATPAPALDHFTCYSAGPSKGAAKFGGDDGVSLHDRFDTATVDLKSPAYLCAPTNKLGEDPTAPTHPEHLEAYKITRKAKFAPRTDLRIVDQFNAAGLRVDLKKPALLMVPSLKTPGGPTPPLPAEFATDHFQCYRAAVTAKTPKFVAVADVALADQFGAMTVDVQKPKLFCAPVDKNGEDPTAPQHAGHLACYQVKQVDKPAFAKQTDLFLDNQLGATQLDAKKPALLCVPATTP